MQAMSLPIVVISHGKQEADAQATIFWDNAFSEAVSPSLFPFASRQMFVCSQILSTSYKPDRFDLLHAGVRLSLLFFTFIKRIFRSCSKHAQDVKWHHKILYINTLKLSYRCMSGMATVLKTTSHMCALQRRRSSTPMTRLPQRTTST